MTLREFLDNLTKKQSEHLKVAVIGPVAAWSPVLTSVTNNAKYSSMFSKYVNIHVPNLDHDGLGLIELINNSHEIGLKLPDNLQAFTNVQQTAKDADILLITTPVNELVEVLDQLSGEIKADAFALSLTHELRKNEYGYVELVCETIKDRLGIPCYTLAGYDQLLPLKSKERQQATLGCNYPAHATILANLINHNDLQLNVCSDIEAVELCGALKDLVEIGAGICNGLHLDDSAKTRIMLEGLNEMIMFFKTFHAERNLVDMFAKCGVPDIFNIEHMNQNMLVAQNFVVTNKPLDQIERECLQGHKLSGASTAESVYHMLKFHNIDKKFPLFTTIHRVCSNLMRAREIVDVTSVNLIGELESAHYKKDIFKIIRNKVQQQYEQLPNIASGTSREADHAPHPRLMPLNAMTTRRMSTKGVIPFEIIYKALNSPNKKEPRDDKKISNKSQDDGAENSENESGRKHMMLVNIQLLKGSGQNLKNVAPQLKMTHYWGSGDLNARRKPVLTFQGTRNVGGSGGGSLDNDDGWLMGMKRIIDSPADYAPYTRSHKLGRLKSSSAEDKSKVSETKDKKTKAKEAKEDNEMEANEVGGFKEREAIVLTEAPEETPLENPIERPTLMTPRASIENSGDSSKQSDASKNLKGKIEVSEHKDKKIDNEEETESEPIGYKHSEQTVPISSNELAKKLLKKAKLNHFELAPIDIDLFTKNHKMCKASAQKLVAEAEAQARAELAKIQLKTHDAMQEMKQGEIEDLHEETNMAKVSDEDHHTDDKAKLKQDEIETEMETKEELHSEEKSKLGKTEETEFGELKWLQPEPPKWYMEIKEKQKELENNPTVTESEAKELCEETEEQLREALYQLKLEMKEAEQANILPKQELELIKAEIRQLENELEVKETVTEMPSLTQSENEGYWDRMKMVAENRENQIKYENEVKEIENKMQQHDDHQSWKSEKETKKQKDHLTNEMEQENRQMEAKNETEQKNNETYEMKNDLFEEIKKIAVRKELERTLTQQLEQQNEKKQARLTAEQKQNETGPQGNDAQQLQIIMKPPRIGRAESEDMEEFQKEKAKTKQLFEKIARKEQAPAELESETLQLIENQKANEHHLLIDYQKVREKQLAQREQRRRERSRRKEEEKTEVKEEVKEEMEQQEEPQQQETESRAQQKLEEKIKDVVKVMADQQAVVELQQGKLDLAEAEAGEIESTAQKLENQTKKLESETKQLENETKRLEIETKALENETKKLEMEMRDALEELEQQQANETKQQTAETKQLQREMRKALEELEMQQAKVELKQEALANELLQVENEKQQPEAELELKQVEHEIKEQEAQMELKQLENEKQQQEAQMELNQAQEEQSGQQETSEELKQTAINSMKAANVEQKIEEVNNVQIENDKAEVQIEEQMKKLETVAKQWDNFMNECLKELESHKAKREIRQSALNTKRMDQVKAAVKQFNQPAFNSESKVQEVKEALHNLEQQHTKEELKQSGINLMKVEQVKRALKEYEQARLNGEQYQMQTYAMAKPVKKVGRRASDLNVLDEMHQLNSDATYIESKADFEAEETHETSEMLDDEEDPTKMEIEQIKSELLQLEMEMEESKKITPTQDDILQIREDLQLIQKELKQLETKLSTATINELRAEALALEREMHRSGVHRKPIDKSDKEQWWQESNRSEMPNKMKDKLRDLQAEQFLDTLKVKEAYKAHKMHSKLAAGRMTPETLHLGEEDTSSNANDGGKEMPPGPMKRVEQLEAAAAASARASYVKQRVTSQKSHLPSLKMRKCCQPIPEIHLPDVKYLHTNAMHAVRQRMPPPSTPASSASGNKVVVPGIIQNKLFGLTKPPLHTHYIKFSGNKSRVYLMQKAIKATILLLKQMKK